MGIFNTEVNVATPISSMIPVPEGSKFFRVEETYMAGDNPLIDHPWCLEHWSLFMVEAHPDPKNREFIRRYWHFARADTRVKEGTQDDRVDSNCACIRVDKDLIYEKPEVEKFYF